MEQRIDLHVHTTASDGTLAPRQTVTLARELGLAAIAVTDHDTTAGLAEAQAAGGELGVEVIPGVEISVGYMGQAVHVLGYFIDPDAPALRRTLDWFVQERQDRNERIVSAMAADGFPISIQALKTAYPGAVLGRPHIAQWLAERGYVSSIDEGFDRYLKRGRPYYRPRRRLPIEQAVSAIRDAGGVACLAHPYQYGFQGAAWEDFIRDGAQAGCRALEVYYSGYAPAQIQALLDAAARYGLAPTGGSDFHSRRKPHIQLGSGTGDLAVPYGVLDGLRRQL